VTVPAHHHTRACAHRVGDVLLHLLQRLHVDQRTLRDAGLQAVANLETVHRLAELGGEGVVDALLYQQPVSADAGLPGPRPSRRRQKR
jgi:hypothetical protein